MIETETRFYAEHYSNIHRGVYLLSQEATEAYDARARAGRRRSSTREARGRSSSSAARPRRSTSSHRAGGARNLGAGDEVLISEMEHHSGIVPWQLACEAAGAALRVIPVDDDGELDLDAGRAALIGPRRRSSR